MTSLVFSLAAPVLGGLISIAIWQAKRNTASVEGGIRSLHDCVHEVSRKVDDVQLDMAKNYCTREELKDHIDKEEDWHDQHHQEVKELRRDFNEKTEKLTCDIAEIKEMQWKMRMEQLDRKNNL